MTKLCTNCLRDKELTEFRKQSSTKDGLKYYCKTCDDAVSKARYEQNKEEFKSRAKIWQQNNREKAREAVKRCKAKKKIV